MHWFYSHLYLLQSPLVDSFVSNLNSKLVELGVWIKDTLSAIMSLLAIGGFLSAAISFLYGTARAESKRNR